MKINRLGPLQHRIHLGEVDVAEEGGDHAALRNPRFPEAFSIGFRAWPAVTGCAIGRRLPTRLDGQAGCATPKTWRLLRIQSERGCLDKNENKNKTPPRVGEHAGGGRFTTPTGGTGWMSATKPSVRCAESE
jgi:hypothetical protein